ncbi:MAG: cytochrome c [Bacteroidia bacterium]|nr:cytochrome c [Bacteroidia bacterium]
MRRLNSITLICSAFAVVCMMWSCSTDKQTAGFEFMPDMYRSPTYKTFEGSAITKDSASALQPVAGTIPRNYSFFSFPSTTEGYEAAGAELVNPLAYTAKNIAEGEVLYNDFCVHCHGKTGDGQGSLIKGGKFPPPPAYTSDQLKDLPVGKMYWTIMYGKNLMGSHASQLTPEERWKVIMHVQSLQTGKDMAADAVEEVEESTTALNSEE